MNLFALAERHCRDYDLCRLPFLELVFRRAGFLREAGFFRAVFVFFGATRFVEGAFLRGGLFFFDTDLFRAAAVRAGDGPRMLDGGAPEAIDPVGGANAAL